MTFFGNLCKELDDETTTNTGSNPDYEPGVPSAIAPPSTNSFKIRITVPNPPSTSVPPPLSTNSIKFKLGARVPPSTSVPPPPRPQKRKYTDADLPKRQPKATKPATTEKDDDEYESDPNGADAKKTYLHDLESHPDYTTPEDYTHGPRHERQRGPLIPYKTHAAMLRGKLDALIIDKARLDKSYSFAAGIHEEAESRLRQHNADQGFLLNRKGWSMTKWREVRGRILTSLRGVEKAMEKAREDAKQRRLRLEVDEGGRDG